MDLGDASPAADELLKADLRLSKFFVEKVLAGAPGLDTLVTDCLLVVVSDLSTP